MSRHQTTPAGLSDRQRRLVDEYLVDLNVSAAARRAGYSPASAKSSSNLLTDQVAQAIEDAIAQRAARTAVTAERVVAELARLAFANMLDFVTIGEDGLPRVDLQGLSRDDGAAIQSLTVDYWRPPIVRRRDRKPGEGPDTRHPQAAPAIRRVRIQLADKRAALIDLARHLGVAWPGQNAMRAGAEPVEEMLAYRAFTGITDEGDDPARGTMMVKDGGVWRHATDEEEAADWERMQEEGRLLTSPDA